MNRKVGRVTPCAPSASSGVNCGAHGATCPATALGSGEQFESLGGSWNLSPLLRHAERKKQGRSVACVSCIATLSAGLIFHTMPTTIAQEPTTLSEKQVTNTHRVYSHLLDPREHPDYDRRAVKPPTWETFKHRTQFTTLR